MKWSSRKKEQVSCFLRLSYGSGRKICYVTLALGKSVLPFIAQISSYINVNNKAWLIGCVRIKLKEDNECKVVSIDPGT